MLIFFGQKCISAIFITFCISDPQESEWWRHKVMVPLLTYREQFHDMKGRIDKCEARRADYDRWSKPSCQCCFQWFTYNRSCMSVCMWRKSDQILFLRKNFFKKKFWIFFSKFSFEILLEIFRWKIFCLKLFFWFFLVTTRQSHPVRAREFLNNRMWGVLSPGLVTGLVMIMMMTIANFFVQSHVHGKRAGDECPSWQTGGSKVISRNQDKNKDNNEYVYFVWPIIKTIKI